MEFHSALPIYLQVMSFIKRDIVNGTLKPGDKLPSVRDTAIQYAINPNTVSRVYPELEIEGISYTKRGMGTFVTEDKDKICQMRAEMAQELVSGFLEGMGQLGITAKEAIELIHQSSGSG